MLWVLEVIILKQELVIQLTTSTIVALVTPELGLVPEDSPNNSNTCGNAALHSSDNGDRDIRAMGYILVQ